MTAWLLSLAVVGVVLAYYGGLDPKLTGLAIPAASRLPRKNLSVHECESILRLAFAAVFQLIFACSLLMVLDIELFQIFGPPSIMLLALGAVIGLGELALGSFLAHVLVRIIQYFPSDNSPTDIRQWIAMSRAGWMQTYLKTIGATHRGVSLGVTSLYVAVEEIVFRGVLITVFLPLGPGWAVCLSTLSFAGVQAFQMPGWRNAIFPVTGALVMGIVHGILFVIVPDVLPLIVAHLMFFLVAAR